MSHRCCQKEKKGDDDKKKGPVVIDPLATPQQLVLYSIYQGGAETSTKDLFVAVCTRVKQGERERKKNLSCRGAKESGTLHNGSDQSDHWPLLALFLFKKRWTGQRLQKLVLRQSNEHCFNSVGPTCSSERHLGPIQW